MTLQISLERSSGCRQTDAQRKAALVDEPWPDSESARAANVHGIGADDLVRLSKRFCSDDEQTFAAMHLTVVGH